MSTAVIGQFDRNLLGRMGLGVVVGIVVVVVACDVVLVMRIRFVVKIPIFASKLARFFEISSSIFDSDTKKVLFWVGAKQLINLLPT